MLGMISDVAAGLAVLEAQVDLIRVEAQQCLARDSREAFGQFFTPLATARLMAEMFGPAPEEVALLDAGAGVGSLTASWVAAVCRRVNPPKRIRATAYEVDDRMLPYLAQTLHLCRSSAAEVGVDFEGDIRRTDFIEAATSGLGGGLFGEAAGRYDAAILNPPYQRLGTRSHERHMLREVGLDAENMYSAFVLLSAGLMQPSGQIVAITPRSFCNGPYFRSFRLAFLRQMSIQGIHVFHARNRAFREDAVLQENVIVKAEKTRPLADAEVVIGSSDDAEGEVSRRIVPLRDVVRPDDPDSVIWVPDDEGSSKIMARVSAFSSTIGDLGLNVSTGRVVDFRARPWLRRDTDTDVVPLIYPANFVDGRTVWPVKLAKPNALLRCSDTEGLLVPAAVYVLVKRFSSKEEPHRLVAAVFESKSIQASSVGFENHLNYFHVNGAGLPRTLAVGLAAYLNSPLVDDFFRLFSGHTQVNATDLRRLPYPSRDQLEHMGRLAEGGPAPGQLSEELTKMVGGTINEAAAEARIEEALAILQELGLPRGQLNERSALTLLALLDLGPEMPWREAHAPLRGITPMMEFMTNVFGRRYAPNTRETVRRQTVHQFVDAGLVVQNPDNPKRPTNSPDNVYQIEAGALDLLRSYGSPEWKDALSTHLASLGTLRARYAAERAMDKIPVEVGGKTILLYPGGQNVLIKQIVEEFGSRFTPGGKVLYIGDADAKWKVFERENLEALGVVVEAHGKMPDVVIHHMAKDWLVLVEAVTSHGPVDAKRHRELRTLFAGSTVGIVYVTAFFDRSAMVKYVRDISWETEVWTADSPSHLIHFNGERFLGPHEEPTS